MDNVLCYARSGCSQAWPRTFCSVIRDGAAKQQGQAGISVLLGALHVMLHALLLSWQQMFDDGHPGFAF